MYRGKKFKKLSPRRSKKMFTRNAKKRHKRNFMGSFMRGGIRL
jgi:hypothetical protein